MKKMHFFGPKMILKIQECIYYSECEKNCSKMSFSALLKMFRYILNVMKNLSNFSSTPHNIPPIMGGGHKKLKDFLITELCNEENKNQNYAFNTFHPLVMNFLISARRNCLNN